MLELIFEFPEGLPRRPRPGDMLKERFFEYEVTSSKFWNGQYLVYAKPVGLAFFWYSIQAIVVILVNSITGKTKKS